MANAPDVSPPAKPGVLFVGSKVLRPSKLAPLDFTDWYENTHIQEVQATGGISGSQRYESLTFHKKYRDPTASDEVANKNFDYDFLTVYNMPDLDFRLSERFRGLDGQSKPSEELMEGLFKHAEFVTRFNEVVEVDGKSPSASHGLLTIATPSSTPVGSLMSALRKLEGYQGMRRVKLAEGTLLSAFERSWHEEPSELALVEFDQLPGREVVEKELGGLEGAEVGWWILRRDYQGSERTPAGWKPK